METGANLSQEHVQRSTFVSVLAWIFIVLAGFALVISILQNIMITVMLPLEEMQKSLNAPEAQEMPAAAKFMFSHFTLFFRAFLVVTLVTFIAAIGLLKRKNWARIIFIVLMALGIAWNIGGVIFQNLFFQGMQSEMTNMPPDARQFEAQFESMMVVMRMFSILLALAFTVLFGWIIKKLASAKIKREFLLSS